MEEVINKGRPPLVCTNSNKASFICGCNTCKNNAFVCISEDCSYCTKKHKDCEIFRVERILEKLDKKKKKPTNAIKKVVESMEKVYDEAIERLSKDR